MAAELKDIHGETVRIGDRVRCLDNYTDLSKYDNWEGVVYEYEGQLVIRSPFPNAIRSLRGRIEIIEEVVA